MARPNVLLSLVRAPALPPQHAYFGSRSHTPYDRCLRFGPRVAATPARLAPALPARLWADQTCTGKLISASPIAPRTGLLCWVIPLRGSGFGRPMQLRNRTAGAGYTPVRFCARSVRCRPVSLDQALPSIPSATGRPALFEDFLGTMHLSDFSGPFIVGYSLFGLSDADRLVRSRLLRPPGEPAVRGSSQ